MTHLSTFAYKAGTETYKEGESEYAFSPVELPADTDRQTDTQTDRHADTDTDRATSRDRAGTVADNPSANQCESQCALYGRSLSPGHVCQVCLVCQSLSQSGNSSLCLSVHLCPGNPSVVVVVFMASHRRNCGN